MSEVAIRNKCGLSYHKLYAKTVQIVKLSDQLNAIVVRFLVALCALQRRTQESLGHRADRL